MDSTVVRGKFLGGRDSVISTPEMPAMRALTLFVATLATASAFMAPTSFAGLQLRSPAICSVPHLPPAPQRA